MTKTKNRIMALDVGDARIGVALSDRLGITAQPKCTIERKTGSYIRDILELVAKEQVETVVIGIPYELSGSLGDQGRKVTCFAKNLSSSLKADPELSTVKVDFWDERFTTREAESVIAGSKLKNRQRRAALDRVSAAIILQSYMACNHKQL